MKDIALTGLARSGKDSVAARLVERHGYVRVAFADRLKEAALKADPLIHFGIFGPHRLSDIVNAHGWEAAKDGYLEVRRFLQNYGQTVREIDPTFWIRAVGDAVRAAHAAGRPVVLTDCRYTNEAMFLTTNGFDLVRVTRPGQEPGPHISEREMLRYPTWRTIVNDDTLASLAVKADALVTR
jgi:hypothetical protein